MIGSRDILQEDQEMGFKRYEELTFTDDFMFCKVLEQNEELCRTVC